MATIEELQVKISADTAALRAGMKQAEGQIKSSTNIMNADLAKLAIAFAAIGLSIKKMVGETVAAAESQIRLEAVVRATGQSAGISAEAIADFAEKMETLTQFDGEGIRDAASALLTFKSIQGETFEAAMRSAMDLSAVFKTDLTSAVIMVGKALENPTQGLLALRRAGISFSAAQKELIRTLVESGQSLKAQEMILAAIQEQVGGTAEALGQGLPGALHRLQIAFEDLFKTTGQTIEDYGLLTSIIESLTDGINTLSMAIIEHEQYWIELKAGIVGVAEALGLVDEQVANDQIDQYMQQRVDAMERTKKQVDDFKAKISGEDAHIESGKYTPIVPGLTDEQIAEQKRKIDEMEKYLEDMRAESRSDVNSFFSSENQRKLDKFRQKLIENKDAFEALGEAGEKMKGEIEANIEKMDELDSGTGYVFERLKKYAEDSADSMADSFARAILDTRNGFGALRNFVGSVMNDIAAEILKLAVTRPIINSVVGGLFGASGGASGGGSSIFAGLGSFFSGGAGGGFDGVGAPPIPVSSTALPPLSGFADGGYPQVGVPSIVGERGPELFVPTERGKIISNHALGGTSITQIFNISPGLAESIDAAIRQAAPVISANAQAGVFAAIEKGGAASRGVGRRI